MKIFKPIQALRLVIISLLGILLSPAALADAGDIIENTVSVAYTSGTESFSGGSAPTATVRFLEDRVVNFTVSEASNLGSSEPGAIGDEVVLSFTIVNTSNAVLDFNLAALDTTDPHGGTDNYNQTVSVFVEDGVTPGYQSADDTATFIDNLCFDGTTSATQAIYNADGSTAAGTVDCSGVDADTVTVYIVGTIPSGRLDGDISAKSLVVTALGVDSVSGGVAAALSETTTADNTADNGGGAGTATVSSANQTGGATDVTGSTIDTVFNDSDSGGGVNLSDGTPTVDIARNGIVSDSDSFLVEAANLVITKTVTVLGDPVNCPDGAGGVDIGSCPLGHNSKAIPGAILEYQITIDNDGADAADDITISDTIDSAMVFETDTYAVGSGIRIITGGTTTDLTNTTDVDIGSFTTPTITVGGATLDLTANVTSGSTDGDEADEAVITFRVELQ